MSIITSQADFDALRLRDSGDTATVRGNLITRNQQQVHDDISTVTDLEAISPTSLFTLIQGTDITLAPGGALMTLGLGTSSTGASPSFTADNTYINMVGSPRNAWRRGRFLVTNSILNYSGRTTGAGGTNEWPGGLVQSNDRPSRYDFSNTFMTSQETLTLSFNNVALGLMDDEGNPRISLAGATLGDGIGLIIPMGVVDYNGITFSNGTAVAALAYAGNTFHIRLNRYSGIPNAQRANTQNVFFDSFYQCDLTAWTHGPSQEFVITSGNNTMTAATFDNYYVFFWDNEYSQQLRDGGGIRSSTTGNGAFGGAGSTQSTIVTGLSMNPRFVDSVTGGTVTDAQIDLIRTGSVAGNVYWLGTDAAAGLDRTVNPVSQRVTTGATRYQSLNTTNGFFIQTDEAAVGATGNATLVSADVPAANPVRGTHNYWSYTHVCYGDDGNVLNFAPTTARQDAPFRFSETQDINTEAESFLNGNTLAQADALNLNGATDADDLPAVLKARNYNDLSDDIPWSVDGTTLDTGNAPIAFLGQTAGIVPGVVVDIHINASLTGGDIIDRLRTTNPIGATGVNILVSNIALEASTVTLNNLTLGPGVTLQATNVNGFTFPLPANAINDLTLQGGAINLVALNADQTVNFEDVFPGITIAGGAVLNNPGTGTITIRNAPTGTPASFFGNNVVEFVEPTAVNVQLTVLSTGTAYVVYDDGTMLTSGVVDGNTVDFFVNNPTGNVEVAYRTRNSLARFKRSTPVIGETLQLVPDGLRLFDNVPNEPIPAGLTLVVANNLDPNDDVVLTMMGNRYSTGDVIEDNVIDSLHANTFASAVYLRALYAQIQLDANITITTAGTDYDAARVTQDGIDLRVGRIGYADSGTGVQVVGDAEASLDDIEFSKTGLNANQLRRIPTQIGTDNEPLNIANRRIPRAPTAAENAAAVAGRFDALDTAVANIDGGGGVSQEVVETLLGTTEAGVDAGTEQTVITNIVANNYASQ